MDPERLSALLSLDPEDRYWHAVDRVAETGVLWALHGPQGWCTPVAPDGFEYLPLWPDRALAQLLVDLLFPGHTPTAITLDEFRGDWIDDLERDNVRVGVFPDSEGLFWDTGAFALYDAIDEALQTRI